MAFILKKVKAFSVLEAVFSMVITAIIIGVVFILFGILTERMFDFKKENQVIADINRLSYTLNKDAFENDKMNVAALEVLFSSYSGEKIRYKVNENYLLREKNDFIDTFYLAIKTIKLDTLTNKNQQIVFQKLNLEMEINAENTSLEFYKRLYSNDFIKSLKLH